MNPMPLTVLIVSSDNRLARLLQAEINARGHITIIAESESEALAMAGVSFQDLILIDSTANGESPIRIARNLLSIRGVTIIVLASSAEEIAKAAEEETGIRGFLLKPFNLQSLWATISEAQAADCDAQEMDPCLSAAGAAA